MKRLSFILILLTILCRMGISQNSPVADSLRMLLRKSVREDTSKVKLLYELSKTFYPRGMDSVEKYAGQALDISKKLAFTNGIIMGLNHFATINRFRNDIPKARELYLQAFSLAEKANNIELLVMVGDNLGLLYNSQGKTDSAEFYYLKAVHVGKDHPANRYYSKLLSDLAMNYRVRANYTEAIRFQLEAKRIDMQNGNRKNEIAAAIRLGLIYSGIRDYDRAIGAYREGLILNDSLKNLAWNKSLYQNIGLLYLEVKPMPDSARHYFLLAEDLARKDNDAEAMFASQVNLGNVEMLRKNFRKSLEYYLKAYESPVFPRKNYERAGTLVNLGIAYLELNQLKEAENYAAEGTALAHRGTFLEFESKGLNALARIAASKGSFREAYLFKMKEDTLQDTIYYDQMKDRVAEAIYQVDLKQAERENILLQQDNLLKKKTILIQWVALAAVVILLLVLVIVVVYIKRTSRRLKALNQALDLKTKELEEINITKDKFISIIAHDLRSPFQALLGLLNELDEHHDEFDEEGRIRIVKHLKKSSQNTYNLLVNLLEWAQAQKGRLHSNLADFNLRTVVDEVTDLLATRASIKSQSLHTEMPDQLPLHSDPQIVKAILLNLLNNGIKFTPSGGNIKITVTRDEALVRIMVSDTGIGIPEERMKDLFRLDSGFNRKGTEHEPGTGLGLILCREYVAMLGGTMEVTSQVEVGTTFTVSLPVKRQEPGS